MTKNPKLHIPQPTARPGEKPDFSYLNLSAAGAVDCPPTDAKAANIEFLALEMVRVLDDDHVAQGPWDPHLDPETLIEALRLMVLTRTYDDRMQRMQRQGKITFYMQALGEEAVSIGQGLAFEPGDMLFPAYRNQGLYIMRDTGLVNMMCQCLSNSRDMCKGRQMPIFYQNKKNNLFTISGNLATQFPQAVGWAMGSAIKGEALSAIFLVKGERRPAVLGILPVGIREAGRFPYTVFIQRCAFTVSHDVQRCDDFGSKTRRLFEDGAHQLPVHFVESVFIDNIFHADQVIDDKFSILQRVAVVAHYARSTGYSIQAHIILNRQLGGVLDLRQYNIRMNLLNLRQVR